MKKTGLLLLLVFAVFFGKAQTSPNSAPTSTPDPFAKLLEFTNAEYDFGKITVGKPVSYVVEIKNISNETITLENAHAGCGCTTPNFTPNQKFAPGETVKVTIQFNGSVTGKFTRFTDINFSNGLTKQTRFSGEGIPATPQQ